MSRQDRGSQQRLDHFFNPANIFREGSFTFCGLDLLTEPSEKSRQNKGQKNEFAKEMRPQSAKSKGRRLQQKVADSILKAFPHLKADDCFSTSMGAQGEDIRMSPLTRESVPLSIECKCQEKLNVWSCLEQANSNCPPNASPCLVFSRNRAPTYAVVQWPFLLELLVAKTKGGGMSSQLKRALKDLVRLLPEEEEEKEEVKLEEEEEEEEENDS